MAKIDEVLANPSKQIKSANGLLNKLFWTVISRAGMTTLRWNEAMRKYVLNPLYVPEQTAPRRFEARNNLITALIKDHTTWNRFIRGLQAMQFWKLRITIEVWPCVDSDPITATIETQLNDPNLIEPDTEEQKDVAN